MTPLMLERIEQCLLEGMSQRATAKKCAISESAVRYHLENTLRPRWHAAAVSTFHADLAKVAMMERVAWERFHSRDPGETRKAIEKALVGKVGKLRVVKEAVRTVSRTGSTAWLEVVQWCIDFRARVFGYQAAQEHRVQVGGTIRVAGKTPAELDEEMLQRLVEKLKERREYFAALERGRN